MPKHATEDVSRQQTIWLRSVYKAAGAFGILLLPLLFTGASVEFALMHIFVQPPPGDFYAIDGYRMHLNCTGSGSPAVILEAGLGDDFLSWRRVQPQLSETTRVCSYDRAGFGWSIARPGPRDADNIAVQLHELLESAHVDGPLILMGHSAGGLFIRKYTALYPQGIVGLVFVDSSSPTQGGLLPRAFTAQGSFFWDEVGLPFGITRLRGDCGARDPALPALTRLMREHNCKLDYFRTAEREGADLSRSEQEVLHTGPFPATDVLIFSEDPTLAFGPLAIPRAVRLSAVPTWNALQEELKQLSPHNRRIIARGSTHYIQMQRPELVIREVCQLIRELRHDAPPRSDYGSTEIE